MLGSRKLDSLIESLDDSSLQAAAAAPHGIIDDIIISDDKSIAESFNDYFINVGINIATESEQLYDISSDDQMPEASIERYLDICFSFI
jgi:hypothetical protein